jgi:ATP-dependent exoDNAse (exonuclease V) alpha subunit
MAVVGSLPSVSAGEWLAAEGCWVRDREHGLQFKATTMKTEPPTTAEGVERYLGSGLVKGIGPILAKKLVVRFGAEVQAVIEKRPAELQAGTHATPTKMYRKNSPGLRFSMYSSLNVDTEKLLQCAGAAIRQRAEGTLARRYRRDLRVEPSLWVAARALSQLYPF